MLGGRLEGRREDQVSGGEDIAKIYFQFLNQVMFKMGVELKVVGRVPAIICSGWAELVNTVVNYS